MTKKQLAEEYHIHIFSLPPLPVRRSGSLPERRTAEGMFFQTSGVSLGHPLFQRCVSLLMSPRFR